MTAQIAAHGRLGRDPRPVETSSGKPMTVASLAVPVETRDGGESGEATVWLDLMAFGRCADDLARHAKGDTVSVAGRLQISRFSSSTTGETRENWQCVADSVISARTVRPGGGRRKGDGAGEVRSGGGRDPGARDRTEGRQRTVWPASGPGCPRDPDPPPHTVADQPFDDPVPFGGDP